MADDIIQVVTTTADKQDAESLAQALLTKRLAGCVQISGPIQSSYWWNGRIETGTEWTCTIKTLRSLYAEVEQTLLDAHPYDQPEVLATAVTNVSAGYARWLREQVQPELTAESFAVPPGKPAVESRPPQTAKAEPVAAPIALPDITAAEAAKLIPAAGPAAAAASNVPQATSVAPPGEAFGSAMPVQQPAADTEPPPASDATASAEKKEKPKRSSRKKTSGPSK
jgi:periplasmic divalent cation tolerance protein